MDTYINFTSNQKAFVQIRILPQASAWGSRVNAVLALATKISVQEIVAELTLYHPGLSLFTTQHQIS